MIVLMGRTTPNFLVGIRFPRFHTSQKGHSLTYEKMSFTIDASRLKMKRCITGLADGVAIGTPIIMIAQRLTTIGVVATWGMGNGPFCPNPGQYILKAGKGSTSAVERAGFACILLSQTFDLLEEIRTSDRIMTGHSIWRRSCLLHSHSQGNRPDAQRSQDDPFPRWSSSYLDLTLISSFPGHPFLSQGI